MRRYKFGKHHGEMVNIAGKDDCGCSVLFDFVLYSPVVPTQEDGRSVVSSVLSQPATHSLEG